MKHVVHFIHGMSMGGAETLVKEYALGIDRAKFKVTVLCIEHLHTPNNDILIQNYFKGFSLLRFLGEQSYYAFATIISIGITYLISTSLFTQATYLSLLGRMAISTSLPPIVFILLVFPTCRFKEAKIFINQLFNKYFLRKIIKSYK